MNNVHKKLANIKQKFCKTWWTLLKKTWKVRKIWNEYVKWLTVFGFEKPCLDPDFKFKLQFLWN